MAIGFFVGCDKVGKSTLFREVLKRTNAHICIDRFTACQYIYGHHHGKGADTPEIHELRSIEQHMREIGGFFIHVTAYVEDIKKRFDEHSEKDIELNEISKILEDYEVYLKDTPLPVLRVNTSRLSIEEAADLIIEMADRIDVHAV